MLQRVGPGPASQSLLEPGAEVSLSLGAVEPDHGGAQPLRGEFHLRWFGLAASSMLPLRMLVDKQPLETGRQTSQLEALRGEARKTDRLLPLLLAHESQKKAWLSSVARGAREGKIGRTADACCACSFAAPA